MKPFLFVLFLFFFLSCSVKDPDESMVLARVGDRVLTAAKLETLLAPEFRTEERVRGFIHEWVDDVVLFLAAVRGGYHNDENLLKQKDDYFKKIVVSAYLQSETIPQIEITKSDILEYYDAHSKSFLRKKDEALVYHFSVNDIGRARSIRAKLKRKKSGDELKKLFEEYGVDSRLVSSGSLVPKLNTAIFDGSAGDVVGPIKTDVGYHVVEIIKKHKRGTAVGLEKVHDEIYQRLIKRHQVRLYSILLDSLKNNANIFINSNYN